MVHGSCRRVRPKAATAASTPEDGATGEFTASPQMIIFSRCHPAVGGAGHREVERFSCC